LSHACRGIGQAVETPSRASESFSTARIAGSIIPAGSLSPRPLRALLAFQDIHAFGCRSLFGAPTPRDTFQSSLRKLDQFIIRHLDRSRGGQQPPGTPCTAPRNISCQRARASTPTPTAFARPGKRFYIAEGSDWFWWFGAIIRAPRTTCLTTCFRKHCKMCI